MKHFKAIAAMSENRVIGNGNKIPWHLPEDFKWFKQMTTGQVVIMGRKTFESLGKPLPSRINIVLTRRPGKLRKDYPELFGKARIGRGKMRVDRPYQFQLPKIGGTETTDLRLIKNFLKLSPAESPLEFFICGGAEIYKKALPFCSDLYLTLVKRTVEGDAFFPAFEDKFKLVEEIRDTPEFKILHYRRMGVEE
jgi:dihydrofolate reductase